MDIHISPENQQYLRGLIETGAFPNQDRAVEEALALMRKRDMLRHEVLRGTEQADRGELLAAEEVFGRLEARASEIEEDAHDEL